MKRFKKKLCQKTKEGNIPQVTKALRCWSVKECHRRGGGGAGTGAGPGEGARLEEGVEEGAQHALVDHPEGPHRPDHRPDVLRPELVQHPGARRGGPRRWVRLGSDLDHGIRNALPLRGVLRWMVP